MTNAPTPPSQPSIAGLISELQTLVILAKDTRVSAEAIGLRISNTWPEYEKMIAHLANIEGLTGTLRWIEAHDRMWTAPEYEKGNEVLERGNYNIKIRGPYGAAANLALKRAALPQSSGVARG